MKSKQELNAIKEKVETLNKKLAELNEEEIAQVVGGEGTEPCPKGLTEMVRCHDCIVCEYNEIDITDEKNTLHTCLLGYGFYRISHTDPW